MSARISDIPRASSFLAGEWELEGRCWGVKRGPGVTPRAQPGLWSSLPVTQGDHRAGQMEFLGDRLERLKLERILWGQVQGAQTGENSLGTGSRGSNWREFLMDRFKGLKLEGWERGGKGLSIAALAELAVLRQGGVTGCPCMLCRAKPCQAVPQRGLAGERSAETLCSSSPRRRGAASSTHPLQNCSRPLSPAPCPPRCLHPRVFSSLEPFLLGRRPVRAPQQPQRFAWR